MVQLTPRIIYPDSDGKPMADNTKQFNWIVLIKENLEILFAHDPLVFIAGDLLWYPVEGNNKLCQAPDAMVAFGRPKGDRGSYKQWQEQNIPPQVVFEILSPSNTIKEMVKKLNFYADYGVEEYYLYDPDKNDLSGWSRLEHRLTILEEMNGWVSPRLGIRFVLTEETLELYSTTNEKFFNRLELSQQAKRAQQGQEFERQRAEIERQRAEQAEQEKQRLIAKLRELGVDPEQI